MSIHVNFSGEEAGSEARDYTPLPPGRYWAKITDVEDKEAGPEAKHPGAPFWNVELTIQDGPYENRKLWHNVMLFDGALYSLSQLMKALGVDITEGDFTVPDGDELISRDVIVVVRKMRDKYREERDGDGEPQFKNEVTGYKPYEGVTPGTSRAGGASSSLLP